MEKKSGLAREEIIDFSSNTNRARVRELGFAAAHRREKMLEEGILKRDCSFFKELAYHHNRVAFKTRKVDERLLEVFTKVVGNIT